MPPIFKVLATIMAWVLWIVALVIGFGTFIGGVIRGDLFNADVAPPMVITVSFAVAAFYAIAAVVVMLLRKKME